MNNKKIFPPLSYKWLLGVVVRGITRETQAAEFDSLECDPPRIK